MTSFLYARARRAPEVAQANAVAIVHVDKSHVCAQEDPLARVLAARGDAPPAAGA